MDIPVLVSDSGVYAIICLPTGKRYIGSSKNLKTRLLRHRGELRHKKHPSCHLQNAWNLYGADQFIIEIVEYCAVEQLLDREQHYLDTIRTFDHSVGFNGRDIATNAGHSFTHSEETKAKVRAHIIATHESRIKNAIKNLGKPFRLKSPTGEIYEGVGIKAFARQHGLGSSALGAVVSGRHRSVKGWVLPDTNIPSYMFKDPNGQQHEIPYKGLASFYKRHDLSPSKMSEVKEGHSPSHKGWHLPNREDVSLTLISPDKQEIDTSLYRIGAFAAEHGLCIRNLSQLIKGINQQYRGWTVKPISPCSTPT